MIPPVFCQIIDKYLVDACLSRDGALFCQTAIRLRHTSSTNKRNYSAPYAAANKTILLPAISHFCFISEKNQLTNRLLSAKIMGLKNSGSIWLRFPIQFNTESCPSGRRCSTRNAVYVMYLGFESLTLRQKRRSIPFGIDLLCELGIRKPVKKRFGEAFLGRGNTP